MYDAPMPVHFHSFRLFYGLMITVVFAGQCAIVEPWNVSPKFFDANRRALYGSFDMMLGRLSCIRQLDANLHAPCAAVCCVLLCPGLF